MSLSQQDSPTHTDSVSLLRRYDLVDHATGALLGHCTEAVSENQEATRAGSCCGGGTTPHRRQTRTLEFPGHDHETVAVSFTETCFCHGKLGHKLWPSGLILSLVLASHQLHPDWKLDAKSLSVVELGAGVGLPSCVARHVLHAAHVTAMDFWALPEAAVVDHGRYVPTVHHGDNLRHNLVDRTAGGSTTRAAVARLDWRHDDPRPLFAAANVLLGSDLLYDAPDIKPLWRTLVRFLRSGNPRQVVAHHDDADSSDEQNHDKSQRIAPCDNKSNIHRESTAKHILLVSPLQPDVREELPAFVDLLHEKADVCRYKVTTRTLRLRQEDGVPSEASEEGQPDGQDEGDATFILIHMVNA